MTRAARTGAPIACGQPLDAVIPANPPVILPVVGAVAAIGDSFTFGTGATAPSKKWVNIVAAAMGAALLNAGIGGTVLQNSADASGSPRANNGRDRLGDVTGANRKDVLFIPYGFNDARYIGAPATFNVEAYRTDFREVLNLLLLDGYAADRIYMATPWWITDNALATIGGTGFTGQTRAGFEAYVQAARDVAVEFGVNLFDAYVYLRDNGFTGKSDGLHPDDAEYAMIALGWQTATYRANTRAPLPSVTASVVGSVATVTATPVIEAIGYEHVIVKAGANVLTRTSIGNVATFNLFAAGDYRAKSRPIYPNSARGPWAFSPTVLNVALPTGQFVYDTFTDHAGVALTNHVADSGGGWVLQNGTTTTGPAVISDEGRVYPSGNNAVYANLDASTNPNVVVEADLVCKSTLASSQAGLAARMAADSHTLYYARWNYTGNVWQLYKTVNNVSTQLSSNVVSTFTTGTKKLGLRCVGTTISVEVDGATIISVTDADIPNAGRAGIRSSGTAASNTTGIHIDNLRATAL